jgi:glycerol-3-phosphate dehydrogenase
VPASRTDQVPLAGADGYAKMRDSHREIAAAAALPAGEVERLLGRYGSDTASLIESMKARPELREPLPGAGGYLGAEVVFACTHEGAVRLDDVLSRRTRITIETRDRGAAAAPRAAALMAPELGWDEARTAAELARYLELIAADLRAESMPDDLAAYQVRAAVAQTGRVA